MGSAGGVGWFPGTAGVASDLWASLSTVAEPCGRASPQPGQRGGVGGQQPPHSASTDFRPPSITATRLCAPLQEQLLRNAIWDLLLGPPSA